MKKLLQTLVFVLVALGLALPALAAQITLNSVVAHPLQHPVTGVYLEVLKAIQERADKEFPGQLRINHRGGTEVIPQLGQVEAVRTGMVDMCMSAATYYTSAMPEMDTMALSEMTPAEERVSPLFAYLQEIHRQKLGVAYVARLGSGMSFYLYSTKPFEKLDDLKGRRIRTAATTIPLLRLLGAEPVSIPGPETFTALERGVAEGTITVLGDLADFGLIPLIKFTLKHSFYRPTNIVLMNGAKWDSLPAGIRNLISEEMSKGEKVIIERSLALEKNILDQLAAGGKFVELSPAELAKFNDMANKALLDTILAKSPVESQKIFDLSRKPK